MSFNYRQFLRQTPKQPLQAYFNAQSYALSIDWSQPDRKVAIELADAIHQLPITHSTSILSDFQRIDVLADDKGIKALINASANGQNLILIFQSLDNNLHRALWAFVVEPECFKAAEEIRYFDYRAEGQFASQYHAAPNLCVSEHPADIDAFEKAACTFFQKRDGSGRHCSTDIVKRHSDNSTQVTLYTEALPNNVIEFSEQGLKRRASRPAIEFVLVYRPEGIVETVAKGGKAVHEALRTMFARHLLKIDTDLDQLNPNHFNLNKLVNGINWAPEASDNLAMIRLRKLKLLPPNKSGSHLIIQASSQLCDNNAKSDCKDWFGDSNPIKLGFKVSGAMISFHFHPKGNRKKGKTLHCELSACSSNLKNFADNDRVLIEKYLSKWHLQSEAA
ncbi:MAG: hypothetical protein HN790_05280 [Methylococcales bacterium]|nr:hypothetical protein [Methylococcales bacterium]